LELLIDSLLVFSLPYPQDQQAAPINIISSTTQKHPKRWSYDKNRNNQSRRKRIPGQDQKNLSEGHDKRLLVGSGVGPGLLLRPWGS